jgi:hypothetical protein
MKEYDQVCIPSVKSNSRRMSPVRGEDNEGV